MEIISSRKNPLIVHLRKLGNDRAYRRQCREFVCDGAKLLEDALASRMEIIMVLCSGQPPELPRSIRNIRVSNEIIEYLSSFKTPQNLIFVCKIPDNSHHINKGRHLILENMQDPGNVGTIIRTANAFGIDSVILTGDCADPYGPKAVRASMGAVFRQRIVEKDQETLLNMLSVHGIPLYSTAPDKASSDLLTAALPSSLALAIGNEGQGLSERLLNASARKLTIPMESETESLNAAAAAAILMWELYKQTKE